MAGSHMVRRITVGFLGVTTLMSSCTSSKPANSTFSVRPVLCYAAPFTPPSAAQGASGLPACGNPYKLIAANLNISASTQQPTASISPDPTFAHIPSTPTSQDKPTNSVVLPGTAGSEIVPGTRFVLGPAGLSKADVQGARADYVNGVGWLVDVTLTSAGSRAWDQLARMQFHAYTAIVVNGVVITAPLMQPSQSTFTSFSGRMQIVANFTQQSAQALVAELQS